MFVMIVSLNFDLLASKSNQVPNCTKVLNLEKFHKRFYPANSYPSAVLGVVILSVHLSVTRVLCDKTKQCIANILIPHSAFLTPTLVSRQRSCV